MRSPRLCLDRFSGSRLEIASGSLAYVFCCGSFSLKDEGFLLYELELSFIN